MDLNLMTLAQFLSHNYYSLITKSLKHSNSFIFNFSAELQFLLQKQKEKEKSKIK